MSILVVGVVLPWLIVGLGCWIGYLLVRQNGRILLRLEALEARLGYLMPEDDDEGLPIGSVAPPFELPDLTGNRVSLEQFRGRRVLLIFFSPDCQWCEKMAPDLAALPWDGAGGRPVPVVISTDDPEDNLELVQQHGIRCPVLLDAQGEISKAYRASGTPTGYLIDEQGLIDSDLHVGGPGLLALATPATSGANGGGGDGAGPAPGNPGTLIGGSGGDNELRSEGAASKREIRLPVRALPKEGIGIGDLVKRVTDAVGIKACRGCERRRQVLNRWVVKGSGGRASREPRRG